MAVETNWVQSFILSFNSINSFGAFDIVDPGSIRYVISIAEQSNKQGSYCQAQNIANQDGRSSKKKVHRRPRSSAANP